MKKASRINEESGRIDPPYTDFQSGEIARKIKVDAQVLFSDEWVWRTDFAAREAQDAGFFGTAEAFRAMSRSEADLS